MGSVIRRRPLLRAVAIGGGAYFECMLRIEATRLVETLQRTGSNPTAVPNRDQDRS
jgi:hypothetical protein